MIEHSDLENLAVLARLELAESEKDKLQADLGSILGYISELSAVEVPVDSVSRGHALVTNVARVDNEQVTETGAYQEDLLSAAPARQGDFVKVKPVLGGK